MAIEKHTKILEYALSSLLRRKGKNLAVMAVFSLLVAVLASILFLTASFKAEAFNLLRDAPELMVQKTVSGRHDFIPEEYMAKIRGIFGVAEVIPRYWGYYYDSLTKGNFTVMGVDGSLRGLEMLKGRLPSGEGECAVGKGVADLKYAGLGREVNFLDSQGRLSSFSVVGIFDSESSILTNDLILLTNQDIIAFFGMPEGRATDIVVRINNDFEVPFIISKIKEMLPETRPIMKSEILRTYDAVFSWRGGMILTMFSGALFAFCILAWDKATGLSAEEKQETGILKAVGWETSDILALKFWEGIVFSLLSFLTGLILAYMHIYLFGAVVFAPVLKGWSVLFPQFRLIPAVSLSQILALFFITVVPYVASTIVPAWRAAITDPDMVMRG